MKQLTMLLILTAAATFAASAGQNQVMTAEVPFPFIMNGARMPAGNYAVSVDRSPTMVMLRNGDAQKAASSLYIPASVPYRAVLAGISKLRFDCKDGQCVLIELWSASSNLGMQLPTPKLRKERDSRGGRAEIRVVEATLSRD